MSVAYSSASSASAGTIYTGTGPVHIVGVSAIESAGSPAVASFELRDTNASGALLGVYKMTASGQTQVTFDEESAPIAPSGTVYCNRTAGTSTVVVYIK